MSLNMEIKARVKHPAVLAAKAKVLSDRPEEVIHQEDTFFKVSKGRLKLRCFPDNKGELIYYERIDQAGPKQSDYTITRTHDPENLKSTLERTLGILGQVRKTRRLFMVGQTRIHVDEVENLGHFMELEVVMHPGQSPEAGIAIARDLMDKLEIRESDLVEKAYIDLLSEGGGDSMNGEAIQ
jgi:predicted adenylyl cyclase CyaB